MKAPGSGLCLLRACCELRVPMMPVATWRLLCPPSTNSAHESPQTDLRKYLCDARARRFAVPACARHVKQSSGRRRMQLTLYRGKIGRWAAAWRRRSEEDGEEDDPEQPSLYEMGACAIPAGPGGWTRAPRSDLVPRTSWQRGLLSRLGAAACPSLPCCYGATPETHDALERLLSSLGPAPISCSYVRPSPP